MCLTSPNGVRLLLARMAERGVDARALAGARIAAIGPGTARALSERGLIADVVPERFVAEGLIEALADVPVSRALVARASEAREVLPDALRERGAEVDVVALYETVAETLSDAELSALAAADYVTFTSSSTVRFLFEAIAGRQELGARTVSIGPVTSTALRERGFKESRMSRRRGTTSTGSSKRSYPTSATGPLAERLGSRTPRFPEGGENACSDRERRTAAPRSCVGGRPDGRDRGRRPGARRGLPGGRQGSGVAVPARPFPGSVHPRTVDHRVLADAHAARGRPPRAVNDRRSTASTCTRRSDQKTGDANLQIDPEERSIALLPGRALLAGLPGVRADVPAGDARRNRPRARPHGPSRSGLRTSRGRVPGPT